MSIGIREKSGQQKPHVMRVVMNCSYWRIWVRELELQILANVLGTKSGLGSLRRPLTVGCHPRFLVSRKSEKQLSAANIPFEFTIFKTGSLLGAAPRNGMQIYVT